MTAVEWLEKKVWELDNEFFTVPNRLVEAISQAKELEKQQIIDCGNSCALKQHLHSDRINKMSESELRQFAEQDDLTFGEEYYNENFKNK